MADQDRCPECGTEIGTGIFGSTKHETDCSYGPKPLNEQDRCLECENGVIWKAARNVGNVKADGGMIGPDEWGYVNGEGEIRCRCTTCYGTGKRQCICPKSGQGHLPECHYYSEPKEDSTPQLANRNRCPECGGTGAADPLFPVAEGYPACQICGGDGLDGPRFLGRKESPEKLSLSHGCVKHQVPGGYFCDQPECAGAAKERAMSEIEKDLIDRAARAAAEWTCWHNGNGPTGLDEAEPEELEQYLDLARGPAEAAVKAVASSLIEQGELREHARWQAQIEAEVQDLETAMRQYPRSSLLERWVGAAATLRSLLTEGENDEWVNGRSGGPGSGDG